MLDYEWDNTSAIMGSGEERHHHQDLDTTRALSIFDPTQTNHHQSPYNNFSPPLFSNQQHLTVVYGHQTAHNIPTNQFHHSFYDPNPYASSSSDSIYHAHSSASALFSFDQSGPAGSGSSYNFLVPKTEVDVSRSLDFSTSNRIGLNLGGRTYFSAGDDDFVSRLYRR